MGNQVFQVNCKSCNGMFVTENVQSAPLLRCPHCRSEAPPRQFLYMPVNDPFQAPQEGMPALLSAIDNLEEDAPDDDGHAAPESEPFRLKGKWLHFDCPHCQWPLRIKAMEASQSLMDCGHCGLEMIPPDPDTGARAELTRASREQLKKIVTNDMRSVRLGKDDFDKSVLARKAKHQQEIADEGEEETVIMRSPGRGKSVTVETTAAPAPKPAAPPAKRSSVKPLAPEQLGKAFSAFEDQTIIGGPSFELTDEERTELEHQTRLRHARIFRYILITAIVFLSGIAFLLNNRLKDERKAAVAHAKEIEMKVAVANAEQQRVQGMFDQAKALAASEDWRSFLPTVRHRHRVESLMRTYYDENPHAPVELASYEKPVAIEIDGSTYEQMTVKTTEGEKRIIGFQHEPDGMKFDWEVFVDIADWEWKRFKEARSPEFTPVRVIAMRTSADDSFYRDANLSRDEAMAVRIWLRDRADSYIALMTKDSPIGQQVDHECKWEIGKLIIADLAFPGPQDTQLKNRLILRRIVQDRWLYSAKD